MDAQRGSQRVRLVRLGFEDAERAQTEVSRLGLGDEALVALAGTASPDLALTQLGRLVDALGNPALLEAVAEREGLRCRLFGVLGTSAALGDHLVAHPWHWLVLADDEVTTVRPTLLGLQRQLLDAVGVRRGAPLPWGSGGARARGDGPDVVEDLRVAYRRALLGLAARDLATRTTDEQPSMAVEDVAAELADLASATLTAGLAVALAGLPEDAPLCRLAVVAMGKCGGRELNYVSDVDVVFVAEAADYGDEQPALRVAARVASAIMRICSQVAWPVDAGLRPEGAAGLLVRTLASHEAYYRRWASTWEFQALLKARPVAGDLALGRAYVETVAPLVWQASARERFVPDVQAMRRRVEQSLPAETAAREVKLGPGGLRDIEFSVQLLQLVHGRADPSVRSGTTLTALDQLAAGGYVAREDARHLAEAYRWLRTVEHRLQLHHLRRTHLLPADGDTDGWRWLARALGHRSDQQDDAVAGLRRERAGYLREVRRLHEKLFYRPLLEAVASLPGGGLTPAAARERLVALGFDDPAAALRQIEALTEGMSRRAAVQRALLPAMLGWFADAADPDAGLLSYRQVSDALGGTPWYLRLLRDEGSAAPRLARLLASSRFVADLFARAPDAVRLLADDAELVPRSREALETVFLGAARRRSDPLAAITTVRGLRRQELLRLACADLLGTTASVGGPLSAVAGATVSAALEVATRVVEAARGPLPVDLAVIAMGRLGGGEQGFGSDADVLFVHEPHHGADESTAARAAQEVALELRRLLALPAPDPPLVVDADLRPEGRQGALSRSLSAHAAYYARWSHVWEAQALLRAAPLAGSTEVTERFLAQVAPVRWPEGGLTAEQLAEVRHLKARVEVERMPRAVDPALAVKLGRGGLADVEWTVQLLQLQHAWHVKGLRTTSTLPAMAVAVQEGLLDADDADVLREAWLLATRVRDALVLVRGKPSVALPTEGRELEGVARALGYPAPEALLESYRQATSRARSVVERVFYR